MMEIAERFELRERIGGGVTTDVYRAHDRKLDQDVVLRLLRDDVVGDDYVERVQREAEAASDIRHSNVVGILDHGVIDGRPFVARELVDGATLEDVLARRGPLPEDEARGIAEQIARGLEAAHERGVLHRDLNSGNVFITTEGTAKVVDFGMPSTPRHPAPEQTAGNTIDERADVYGLGVVLYQMLTGHIPRGRPVPPRRLVKGVSKSTNALVMRALEKDPALRYPTAAAIADELRPREAAEGRPAVMPPVIAAAAATAAVETPAAARIESAVAAAPVEPPPAAPVEPAAMTAPIEPPTAAPVESATAATIESPTTPVVEPPAATTPIEPPAPVPIETARVEPVPRVEPRVPVAPVRPIPMPTVPERVVPPRERVEPIPIPIRRSAPPADPTERIARPARSRRRAIPAALLALLTLPLLLALLVGAGNLARPRAPETAVLSATTTPVATATATTEPAAVPTPLATLIPPVETTPVSTPVATAPPPPPVVTQPPAAVAPPPAPPQPPAPVAPNSASATVRSFYELIEQERFDEAAALWSARMKANYPPSANIHGRFDRTRQIVIRSISPVATNTGGATVAIDILEVLDSGVTRRWIGQWQLVWDGARWLMDAPSLRAG